jgi:hypothetical protein
MPKGEFRLVGAGVVKSAIDRMSHIVIRTLIIGVVIYCFSYACTGLSNPGFRRKTRAEISAFLTLIAISFASFWTLAGKIIQYPDRVEILGCAVLAAFCLLVAWSISTLSLNHQLGTFLFLRRLDLQFDENKQSRLPGLCVLVASTDLLGRIYANRIAAELSQMTPGWPTHTWLRCIPIELLVPRSQGFRRRLMTQAHAMIIVRGLGPDGTDESSLEYDAIIPQCRGKLYEVKVSRSECTTKQMINPEDADRMLSIALHHHPAYLTPAHKAALRPIVYSIASCAAVMHGEETRIGHAACNIAERLLRSGFQPIARVYSRFRLSSSDTERLLSLCDCFEVLIKACAFLLIKRCEQRGQSLLSEQFPARGDVIPIKQQLGRLTIGDWLKLLQTGLKYAKYGPLEEELADFWANKLPERPFFEVIDAASGSGLALQCEEPRTHLKWLSWLVQFRNSTKGHGVVREAISRPIWPSFHEAFLSAVEQLPKLLFEIEVAAQVNGEKKSVPNGWPLVSYAEFDSLTSGLVARWRVDPSEQICTLDPLLILDHGVLSMLLTVKRRKAGDKYSYIDHGTGKIVYIPR